MNIAKLRLFDALDGGDHFWSSQIREHGPDEVLEKILGRGYKNSARSTARQLARLEARSETELIKEIDQSGGRFITAEDGEWPHLLNDLIAPPLGLIVKGERISCNAIGIVGTRNPTSYGARIASDFAAGFSDRGLVIISGGAYGIDSHAHRGALSAEGKTYAVLASGISVNYPAGNERLFADIAENGALISEVMPLERARPERFLTRNRLIAALSRATIVVEAAFRSGSLRTAREAAELLRTVLAVPGPITSPTSDGSHRLIGERTAEIVTSVSDAMELIDQTPCTLCGDDT
jgi:DNA processing protein